MTRTQNDEWPAERVEEFRRLWATDMTISQIATALGVTRNAVSGKRCRLGLPGRGSPIRHGRRPKPPRKPKPRAVKPVPAPKAAAPARPNPLMLAATDLTPRTCRYPIGDPGAPGFGFCGHAVTEFRCYCDYHHGRTHTKPEPRPENRRPKSLAQLQAEKINV